MRPAAMMANYAALVRTRRFLGYLLLASFAFAGLFAFLAGSSYVFIDVLHVSEREFGLLFGCVMLGNFTGATLSSRIGPRLGIDRTIRSALGFLVAAGLVMAALSWAGVNHPLAVIVPMFVYMIAFMIAMPQATAGALTPFPRMAGSASALLSFCQFLVASSSALAVGLSFDGTSRPMTTLIALGAVLAAGSFALLVRREPAGRLPRSPMGP